MHLFALSLWYEDNVNVFPAPDWRGEEGKEETEVVVVVEKRGRELRGEEPKCQKEREEGKIR